MKQIDQTTLIAHMELDRPYTIDQIHDWFESRQTVGVTRKMLTCAAHVGMIVKRARGGRQMEYVRVLSTAEKAIDPLTATPPAPPNLKSTLAGYDREISRHVELAMMVRR